ncbi:MAG: nucleotidyl transferase AbiEii/AbiGii toxin family protein [Clostridia bacterium]|nr:nucleotidyl transferase AbiEii/AbiGii toxin family protein [Clostridia bacterium]
MHNIVKLPNNEREALFRNTSQKMNLHEAIIEKDFWVCFSLDYLFHQNKWKDAFTFKGGTSLSKAYGLINRFSEDIDLILDWRLLGFDLEEPWQTRSNSKQDAFNKQANQLASSFLKLELLPVMKSDLSTMLGLNADCFINEDDPQTINFNYPHIYNSEAILQTIRLEIGALAAWSPARKTQITSYAAEQYKNIFAQPSTEILTVLPERTFWEKVTILHHEANRPKMSLTPQRYSRHYYDLHCMAHSDVKDLAFEDIKLLEKVVDFKRKFYPRGWAKYEEAKPGTLKLIPSEGTIEALRADYDNMREMMFGEYPTFDEIMETMKILEHEINQGGQR